MPGAPKTAVPASPRRSRRAPAALAAAIVVTLLAPAPGLAAADGSEPDKVEALRALREGNRLFDAGDYQGALARYQNAYDRIPSPKLFFNFGQVYRTLGRPVDALDFYERFLAEAHDAAPALRAEAERHRAQLQGAIASIEVTAEDQAGPVTGAEVSVDGAACGTTPLPRPVRVMPGPHEVVVRRRAGGAPFVERVEARAGGRAAVTARWPAAAATAPRPAPAIQPPPPSTAARAPVAPDARIAAGTRASSGLGVVVRADLDWRLAGAGAAGALTYAAGTRAELAAGGFLWPVQGHTIGGASLGGTIHPGGDGRWRPLLSADAQLYFDGGAHWAARAAAGLRCDLTPHLGLFAAAGVEHTSTTFAVGGARTAATFFVPALGVLGRL